MSTVNNQEDHCFDAFLGSCQVSYQPWDRPTFASQYLPAALTAYVHGLALHVILISYGRRRCFQACT